MKISRLTIFTYLAFPVQVPVPVGKRVPGVKLDSLTSERREVGV